MTVFHTLGHSTKTLDELAQLCRGAGVDVVCDVRRFPRSRRRYFYREALEKELPPRDISYEWLGAELGGFREEGYEAWMRTPDFERGLVRLEELASERSVGFMCSEGQPTKCHRRFIAHALVARGHRVAHLLPDGEIFWEQPPLSRLDL